MPNLISQNKIIAEVIPATKTSGELERFSYLVPDNLVDKIQVGSIADIPFGKRKIKGIVFNISRKKQNKSKYSIKKIFSLDQEFILPQKYIKIAEWIADYYFCSLGEAIELFLPPQIKNIRKFHSSATEDNLFDNELNFEQELIFKKLKNNLYSSKKKPSLLFGVTGSGKTEIYIKLAKETVKLKKQVIILVPEIILTPQTVKKFQESFGDQICLMHSGLSQSEKYHYYHDFYKNIKPIIIGPRSALLVPSQNLGLIIIDEEQEDAYKQGQNPKYHAVDLAQEIASQNRALLLLGSATPRIETFYKSRQGIFELLELKNRYRKLIMPPAEIVDLKSEIKNKNFSPISEKLKTVINLTLNNNKQLFLYLNRRGSSTFISCRQCGEVILCPRCEIPLIHHLSNNLSLRCHHCNFKRDAPTICPKCKSSRIKYFGSGVEKIEIEIKNLFPKARVRRVDSTTVNNKMDYQNFYKDLINREIDIVVGTQMIAKGFDIPGVDLVGVVSADVGLHLPYFRSSEKTFRLLTQISGRSGRSENSGQTIIQTYWPDSRAIKFASKHDYFGFYNQEIITRKKLNYPPFSNIIRVVSENTSIATAKKNIDLLASDLSSREIDFIGPGLCFYHKIRNRFRYHVLIKINNQKIKNKISEIYKKHPNIIWDVDPNNIL